MFGIKTIFLIRIYLFNTVESYPLICPSPSQWRLRSDSFNNCNLGDHYMCLFNESSTSNTELCRKPVVYRKGLKLIWHGDIDADYCREDRFQPFNFWTNGSSTCVNIKSKCNDEGQIKYGNGTGSKDVTCICDSTKGFQFLYKPMNTIYCTPSEEDCTCFANETIQIDINKAVERPNITRLHQHNSATQRITHYVYNAGLVVTILFFIVLGIMTFILVLFWKKEIKDYKFKILQTDGEGATNETTQTDEEGATNITLQTNEEGATNETTQRDEKGATNETIQIYEDGAENETMQTYEEEIANETIKTDDKEITNETIKTDKEGATNVKNGQLRYKDSDSISETLEVETRKSNNRGTTMDGDPHVARTNRKFTNPVPCSETNSGNDNTIEVEKRNENEELYKGSVFHENNGHGISTEILTDIMHLLNTTDTLIIVGSPGSGKSTICSQLLKRYEHCFTIHRVSTTMELLPGQDLENDIMYIFDDAFGSISCSFKRKEWQNCMCKLKECQKLKRQQGKRTIVVLTSRASVLPESLPFSTEMKYIDKDMRHSDLLKILEYHIHQNGITQSVTDYDNAIKYYSECNDNIGFPLCAYLFASHFATLHDISFFKRPMKYLSSGFQNLTHLSNVDLCIAHIISIHRGHLIRDTDLFNDISKERMKYLNVDSIADIERHLEFQMGPFVKIDRSNTVQFVHPNLLMISDKLLHDVLKSSALNYISLYTMHTCSKHMNIPFGNISYTNYSPDDVDILIYRLLQEIMTENVLLACSHSIWDTKNAAQILVLTLDKLSRERNEEKKSVVTRLFEVEDNIKGEGVLYWAVFLQKEILRKTLLELLRSLKEFDLIPSLLSRSLIGACYHENQLYTVIEMIKYGADVSYCKACELCKNQINQAASDFYYEHVCPLQAALKSGDKRMVKYLLMHGAVIPHSKWIFWDLLKSFAKHQINCIALFELSMAIDNIFSQERNREFSCSFKQISNYKFALYCEMLDKTECRDLSVIFFKFIDYSYVSKSICGSFLEVGLDINSQDHRGYNALQAFLSRMSMNPDDISPEDGEFVRYLLEKGCNPNNRGTDGMVPLHMVIGVKSLELLEILLKAKADVNKRNSEGLTPLHLCISSDASDDHKLSVARVLLKNKLDLSIRDSSGRLYTNYLLDKFPKAGLIIELSSFPLHECLESPLSDNEKLRYLEALLKEHKTEKTNVNTRDNRNFTPLFIAATELYSLPLTEFLLDNGADANMKYDSNLSIIQILLLSKRQNVVNMVVLLLRFSCSFICHDKDYCGNSIVMTALTGITNRFKEIREILDDNESALNLLLFVNNQGQSFLHLCCGCSHLTDDETEELCKTYLSIKSDIDTHDACDVSPLEYAAKCRTNRRKTVLLLTQKLDTVIVRNTFLKNVFVNGHLTTDLLKILEEKGKFVEEFSERRFILHDMAGLVPISTDREQVTMLIKYLCKEGIDVNKKDRHGNTPLHISCMNNINYYVASTLIEEGSDPTLQNEEGNTALHECVQSKASDMIMGKICDIFKNISFDFSIRNKKGLNVLLVLIKSSFLERQATFLKLLTSCDNINQADYLGNTLLHHLVMIDEDDYTVAKQVHVIMMKRGELIDINSKNIKGSTALHMACCNTRNTRVSTITKLINHGAEVNITDENRRTCLFNVIRCLRGHEIKIILERFARVAILLLNDSSTEGDGAETPQQVAQSKRYKYTLSILVDASPSNIEGKLSEIAAIICKHYRNGNQTFRMPTCDKLTLKFVEKLTAAYIRVSHCKLDEIEIDETGSDYSSYFQSINKFPRYVAQEREGFENELDNQLLPFESTTTNDIATDTTDKLCADECAACSELENETVHNVNDGLENFESF